jgi:intracellular sulfur oxidation DsrE/DsrF family protein
MNHDEAMKIKVLAAKNAIDALGGKAQAAEKLAALSGRHITRYRVRYWLETGIDPKFCPHVHQLTKIPLTQLDPEVYPVYLFAS